MFITLETVATETNVQYVKLLKNVIYPTPVVIINGKLENYYDNCASVSSDEYEAMFQAVDYLTGLGHSKIGFLGGIRGVMSTDIKLDALQKAGSMYDFIMKNEWIKLSSYTYQGGVEAMKELLKEKDLPTAIISINDEVAAGVINTCISNGYRVPDDFSVMGFDNSSISTITMPKITTLAHPYEELGSIAVNFLNNMINEKSFRDVTNISLKMSLVERESCSAPRKWQLR